MRTLLTVFCLGLQEIPFAHALLVKELHLLPISSNVGPHQIEMNFVQDFSSMYVCPDLYVRVKLTGLPSWCKPCDNSECTQFAFVRLSVICFTARNCALYQQHHCSTVCFTKSRQGVNIYSVRCSLTESNNSITGSQTFTWKFSALPYTP